MVPKLEHSVLKLPLQKSMASCSFPFFKYINGAILKLILRSLVKCLDLVKLQTTRQKSEILAPEISSSHPLEQISSN